MSDLSKSPERLTFQRDCYIKRAQEEGQSLTDPNVMAMLKYYQDIFIEVEKRETDTNWRINNMEHDLRTADWILDKVRNNDTYAQNLYAAMCNNDFQQHKVWPIIKGEIWTCSWRYAGGIIADMRESGDYIDWYCSGIGDGLGNGDLDGTKGYVSESVVTDEIREDLRKLGWVVLPEKEQGI